jgi:hypothetical protein
VSARDRADERNERVVGLVALLVAAAAMALDHLVGTDRGDGDGGLVDPPMFAISMVLSVAAAVLLFGWLVPPAAVG